MFSRIILTCHVRMQYDRSISAVYYLLQGKQSIQTIQDAQLYGLNSFYGIYKSLSKERFNDYVHTFVQQKLLEPIKDSNYYVMTEKGQTFMLNTPLEMDFLDGNSFRTYDLIYYSRLLLLIQVWTNSKKKNKTYIPIIENIEVENWVKQYYRATRNNISEYLTRLYKELAFVLNHLPSGQPSLFVEQITSYKTIGYTMEQLAKKSGLELEDVYVQTVNTIHLILKKAKENKQKYRLLYAIGKDLFLTNQLTESAERTSILLNQGLSLQEISRVRRLKLNTIYDHVVEISLNDQNFNLAAFVPKRFQDEIIRATALRRSYKLKEIKDCVDQNISYFQIRLVLSRLEESYNGSE